MAIIFDIIILGIIVLCTLIGYKQGLVKSAIKILSFFIAIAVALVLYKPVTNLIINNTPMDDNIKNTIIEKIKPDGIEKDEEIKVEDSNVLSIIGNATSTTIETIADAFTIKIIETVTLLLIYVFVKIALKFVSALTDLITKLPLLKQANKAGGIIYGILKGVILVYTLLAVIYLITPLLNNNISENINKSIITKFLYNNNIILEMIM